jgi:nucleoside-diphosphate-sugar epimerase
MHILVTGGCGYVGVPLSESLLARGFDVTVVDIQWFGNALQAHPRLRVLREDIRNVNEVPMAGVDAVIHLANVANDPCAELDAKLSWEVNALATKFLVERAIDAGVRQFIYASSGSVYGVTDAPEVVEDLPLVPITDYNKTKMISERVLLSYADRIVINIVRPATVCGFSRRMRLDLSVNMLTMQALVNRRITVFGGNQVRPNIHVRDLVRAYHHFLDRGPSLSGIYNAGFENMTIREIAELVCRYAPAEIVTTPSNDPRSYRLSSKKLLATGFAPESTVEQSIKELVAAFHSGALVESENAYNMKAMKKLAVA